MAIIIDKPIEREPEPDFHISKNDMQLVKDIVNKCGEVAGVRVVRWLLPKCSLKTAVDFVRSI